MKQRNAVLVVTMLLSACGGGDDSGTSPQTGNSPPPPSSSTPADTTAPTVSASANVSSTAVTLVATTTDNVGVSSVNFFVDDGLIQGTVTKNPDDGTFSLPIAIGFFAVGDHTLTAVAVDAAGNSTTSAAVTFTIVSSPGSGTDSAAPVVTAAVEGNFGLVKLTAIATDDVRIDAVRFTVDGAVPGIRATPAYVSTDPENQYVARFDTTNLSAGPHYLVATARDRSGNVTDSTQVVFNVDPSAGLIELEDDGSIATAIPVPRTQSQIAGRLQTQTIVIDELNKLLKPDWDYYRISLASGETFGINMLSTQGFFLSVLDADGNTLVSSTSLASSDVSTVSYTNDSTAKDVYIQVTSGPYDFQTNDQYKLTLSFR